MTPPGVLPSLREWTRRVWGALSGRRTDHDLQRELAGHLALAEDELDRLLSRDGLTYEEAVEVLLARGVADSRASLDAMRPKLAVRTGRWMVGTDCLPHRGADW